MKIRIKNPTHARGHHTHYFKGRSVLFNRGLTDVSERMAKEMIEAGVCEEVKEPAKPTPAPTPPPPDAPPPKASEGTSPGTPAAPKGKERKG